MFDPSDKENKHILKYLKGQKVLLVDPTSSNRRAFKKIFLNMGIENSDMDVSDSIEDAMTKALEMRPNIIVSISDTGENFATELLDVHKQIYPNRLKANFIYISKENSKAAAAVVLDHDIDAYIVMPYTSQAIEDAILSSIQDKIKPSVPYQKLEAAKELIYRESYDDALKLLKDIQNDELFGALAHFKEGKMYQQQNKVDEAENAFKEGLIKVPNHYKCASALAGIYWEKKMYEETYDLLHMLCSNYPINPSHIPHLTRISIVNAKYEDVENYGEVFDAINEKTDLQKKYIAAGLATCGKFLVSATAKTEKGVKNLKQAVDISEGNPVVVESVVRSLLRSNNLQAVKEILTKYSLDNHIEPTLREVFEFDLFCRESSNIGQIMTMGRKILKSGNNDPEIYEIYLTNMIEANLPKEKIEDFYFEAKKEHPDNLERFNQIVKHSIDI
jgi:tetratricopeptide (TPR) repeat protein